jgi:hypothetical protein
LARSSPKAEKTPGDGGTITVPISISRAIAAAKSGPLPPKAKSAKSRGSRPRSIDTARIACSMFAAAIR